MKCFSHVFGERGLWKCGRVRCPVASYRPRLLDSHWQAPAASRRPCPRQHAPLSSWRGPRGRRTAAAAADADATIHSSRRESTLLNATAAGTPTATAAAAAAAATTMPLRPPLQPSWQRLRAGGHRRCAQRTRRAAATTPTTRKPGYRGFLCPTHSERGQKCFTRIFRPCPKVLPPVRQSRTRPL